MKYSINGVIFWFLIPTALTLVNLVTPSVGENETVALVHQLFQYGPELDPVPSSPVVETTTVLPVSLPNIIANNENETSFVSRPIRNPGSAPLAIFIPKNADKESLLGLPGLQGVPKQVTLLIINVNNLLATLGLTRTLFLVDSSTFLDLADCLAYCYGNEECIAAAQLCNPASLSFSECLEQAGQLAHIRKNSEGYQEESRGEYGQQSRGEYGQQSRGEYGQQSGRTHEHYAKKSSRNSASYSERDNEGDYGDTRGYSLAPRYSQEQGYGNLPQISFYPPQFPKGNNNPLQVLLNLPQQFLQGIKYQESQYAPFQNSGEYNNQHASNNEYGSPSIEVPSSDVHDHDTTSVPQYKRAVTQYQPFGSYWFANPMSPPPPQPRRQRQVLVYRRQ